MRFDLFNINNDPAMQTMSVKEIFVFPFISVVTHYEVNVREFRIGWWQWIFFTSWQIKPKNLKKVNWDKELKKI